MYGVNASVPKTLVRHLVQWAADGVGRRDAGDAARHPRHPVSPELLRADEEEDRAEDRRPRGPLRAPRLLPLPLPPHGAPARRRSSSPSRRSPTATTVRRSSAGCGPSSGASSRSSSGARRCPTVRRWGSTALLAARRLACPPTPRRRCGSRSRVTPGEPPDPDRCPALRNRPTPILAPGSRPTNEHEQTQTHDE